MDVANRSSQLAAMNGLDVGAIILMFIVEEAATVSVPSS
jgi:hypothetical protein